MTIISFYDMIESAPDKSADLKTNLTQLYDDLLQRGDITDPAILSALAQLRAQVQITLT